MNTRTDTHDSYGFPPDASPFGSKMNTRANELHTTQREPIRLDDLANDHYWRLLHLRDLLVHLEEINLQLPPLGGSAEAAVAAMLYSALALAREATEEASRLNIKANEFDMCLMAMPGELLPDEDDSNDEPAGCKVYSDKGAGGDIAAPEEMAAMQRESVRANGKRILFSKDAAQIMAANRGRS